MIYFFYSPLLVNSPLSWINHSIDTLAGDDSLKAFDSLSDNKLNFSPTVLQAPTPDVPEVPPKFLPEFHSGNGFSLEKKKSVDEDYNPDCQVTKKIRKSKQLENRNVVPNIVRLVLSYVQKPGKCSRIVEKLLKQKLVSGATAKRYFLYHKLVKAKIDNYVHEDTLAQLVQSWPEHNDVYSSEEQQLYNTITRKLILHFLQHQASACVLTSKRMEQAKKQDHVRAIRGLIYRLKSTMSQ